MERPFAQTYSDIAKAWEKVARTLRDAGNEVGQYLASVEFSGSKCQDLFKAMIDLHRKEQTDSLRASGIDEDFDDLVKELGELEADFRDFEEGKKNEKGAEAAKRANDAAKAAWVRETATQTMSKKRAASAPTTPG